MTKLTIVTIADAPLDVISFVAASPLGAEPSEQYLPIFTGTVRGLPETVSSLVIASDLQGVVMEAEQQVLLGEHVAEYLDLLYAIHFPAVSKANTIALLCGDLYGTPWKRGASGNPLRVWEKFSAVFGCTVGIAGNHDVFGEALARVMALPGVHFLANGTVHLHGLQIAGVSGVIGRPDRPFRLPEAAYAKAVSTHLKRPPDLFLTHLSPRIEEKDLQGEERLTTWLRESAPTLVLCGHSHWPTHQPQVLRNGTQVLNADTKVFILTRA
jgi:Icc-related predicted phosphoesterase